MITYYIKKYCFEYVSRHLFLKRRNFSLCVHFWNISFLVFKVFEFDLKAFMISKLSVKHRLHFLEFWLYEFANVLIDQSILKLAFFPFLSFDEIRKLCAGFVTYKRAFMCAPSLFKSCRS